LVEKVFPKLFAVGITSKVDVDVLASGHEVDVMDDPEDTLCGDRRRSLGSV
jgi:hypothetical protein